MNGPRPNPSGPPPAAGADSPSRNDGVTLPEANCSVCGRPVARVGRRRYCSAACRQAAWRQRHPTPLPAVPVRSPRAALVYECPECSSRYLGEQRCPECHLFCRRVGPGGRACVRQPLLAHFDRLNWPTLTPSIHPW